MPNMEPARVRATEVIAEAADVASYTSDSAMRFLPQTDSRRLSYLPSSNPDGPSGPSAA
jgi:hypothetical protein